LQYLLASRYFETDLLMNEAWPLFGHLLPGWSRVQAICDFVNLEITFGYPFARPTKSALETLHYVSGGHWRTARRCAHKFRGLYGSVKTRNRGLLMGIDLQGDEAIQSNAT
jgi:hypothetical protein